MEVRSLFHPPLDPHMAKPLFSLLSLTGHPYEVCSRIYVSVVLFLAIHGNLIMLIVVTKE